MLLALQRLEHFELFTSLLADLDVLVVLELDRVNEELWVRGLLFRDWVYLLVQAGEVQEQEIDELALTLI